MNDRNIPDNIWKEILSSILNKIEKASGKDTFYIAMSIGKGKIKSENISSDIFYTLYLNASKHMNEFDLY